MDNTKIAERVASRFKGAVSRPAAKGNPAQEALSDAWDYLDDYFYKYVPMYATDVEFSMADTNDWETTKFEKVAEKMSKGLVRSEKQTRSWRSGLNLWLEGRDIDVGRLARDVIKTVSNLKITLSGLEKLAGIQRAHPEVWSDLKRPHDRAVQVTEKTIEMFDKSVELLNKAQ